MRDMHYLPIGRSTCICGAVDASSDYVSARLARVTCEKCIDTFEADAAAPIPMLLWCPLCHARHIDVDEFATRSHAAHSCQNCGLTWKPAKVPTVGVMFLPGYRNEPKPIAITVNRKDPEP